MKFKVMAVVAILALLAALNAAVRKFGKLDVMTFGFVIFSIIFLGILIVRARNE